MFRRSCNGIWSEQTTVDYHNTTPQKFNNPMYNFLFFSATTGSSKFTSLDTQPPSFSCYWPLQSSSTFGMQFFVLCSTYLMDNQSSYVKKSVIYHIQVHIRVGPVTKFLFLVGKISDITSIFVCNCPTSQFTYLCTSKYV